MKPNAKAIKAYSVIRHRLMSAPSLFCNAVYWRVCVWVCVWVCVLGSFSFWGKVLFSCMHGSVPASSASSQSLPWTQPSSAWKLLTHHTCTHTHTHTQTSTNHSFYSLHFIFLPSMHKRACNVGILTAMGKWIYLHWESFPLQLKEREVVTKGIRY